MLQQTLITMVAVLIAAIAVLVACHAVFASRANYNARNRTERELRLMRDAVLRMADSIRDDYLLDEFLTAKTVGEALRDVVNAHVCPLTERQWYYFLRERDERNQRDLKKRAAHRLTTDNSEKVVL